MLKRLFLALLLISPVSFADWGDVYYCQMTTLSETTLEGKRTDYLLEKFTFKLDETKKAMVFGKGGYFADSEKKIVWSEMGLDSWEAVSDTARLFFSSGRLVYAAVTLQVTSMTADCNKL
jgi:hypothetical protein